MLDYIIGSEQSRYAGIAIFVTMLFICVAILFTEASIGSKLYAVLILLLISAIPIAFSLFELTCIVTGGKNTSYNMCNIYAWVLTGFIIIYCFMLIVSVLSSIFVYKKAGTNVDAVKKSMKIDKEDEVKIAKNIIKDADITETFYQQPEYIPEAPVEAKEPAMDSYAGDAPLMDNHDGILGYDDTFDYAPIEKETAPMKAPVSRKEPRSEENVPMAYCTDDNLSVL